jgi:hypothetical protein
MVLFRAKRAKKSSVVSVLNPAKSAAREGGRGADSSRFQRTSLVLV